MNLSRVSRLLSAAAVVAALFLVPPGQANAQTSPPQPTCYNGTASQWLVYYLNSVFALPLCPNGVLTTSGGGGGGGGGSSTVYNGTGSQALVTSSYLGVGGTYNSTAQTFTSGQYAPFQVDGNGYLDVHVQAGGGSGGSTTFPYSVASAAPTPNSFVGISGYDGTNVRPVAIDPTTGYLLTKSGASVNGTYGAPGVTVSPAATSVQYEQGVGPNGTFLVQGVAGGTPIPVTGSFVATTSFPYNMTGSGQTALANSGLGILAQYLTTAPTLSNAQVSPLELDSSGNLKVNVAVGGSSGGGSSPPPYPMATATATANSGYGAIGQYNAVPATLSNGAVDPLQEDINGALYAHLVQASTATVIGQVALPYSTSQAQPGNVSNVSSVGDCLYYSSVPTLTSGQVNPCSVDASGYLNVDIKAGGTSGATPAPYATNAASQLVVAQATTVPAQLVAGTAQFGSIGNTSFGITSAGTAGGGAQSAAAIPSISTGCVYNTATPAPTNGQFVPLQCSASGGLIVSGSFTATTSFPYSLVTQGQTALANSGIGSLGVYNSSAPTLSTGQAAPLQLDSAGNLDVNVKVGGSSGGSTTFPYNATAQTATTASFLGAAGQYNSTAPTLTNGQIAGLQLNSSGALLVAGTFSATTTFPYSNANAQTGTSASFLGMACAYNGATAPTLTSGSVNPLLCNSVGDQLVALDTTTGLGSSATTPTIGRIESGSNTSLVFAAGGSTSLSTSSVGLETLSQGYTYVPGAGLSTYQANVADYKTGATPYGAIPLTNPGGSLATAITTAATTTCTAVETNVTGRIGTLINAAATAQTITLSLYDEGASPTCAAADLRYSVVLGASQVVTLNIPVTAGIAYQVSAAPSANIIVTRN